MTTSDQRVCLGAFAGAHGVKGDLLIKVFAEAPENIARYGAVQSEDGASTFSLTFIRDGKPGFAIARAAEVKSREDAIALKGARFYVDRDALPSLEDEDDFYIDDLVGLKAIDETGAPAGHVSAVYNFGADDMLELAKIPGEKGLRIIPFTKEAVPAVDVAGGAVTIAREAINAADPSQKPDH